MSYDADSFVSSGPPAVPRPDPSPRDLEVLVTLLELAAIELTPTTGATFTRGELLSRAVEIGGVGVRHVDLRLMLRGVNFLRREASGRWSLR